MLHVRALCYIYGLHVIYTGLCYIYGLYICYNVIYIRVVCYIYALYVTQTGSMLHIGAQCYMYDCMLYKRVVC